MRFKSTVWKSNAGHVTLTWRPVLMPDLPPAPGGVHVHAHTGKGQPSGCHHSQQWGQVALIQVTHTALGTTVHVRLHGDTPEVVPASLGVQDTDTAKLELQFLGSHHCRNCTPVPNQSSQCPALNTAAYLQ